MGYRVQCSPVRTASDTTAGGGLQTLVKMSEVVEPPADPISFSPSEILPAKSEDKLEIEKEENQNDDEAPPEKAGESDEITEKKGEEKETEKTDVAAEEEAEPEAEDAKEKKKF